MFKIFCGHAALQEATGSPLPKPTSELALLFGLLDKAPDEPRYLDLVKHCKENIQYIESINDEFDVACLPYKFSSGQDAMMLRLNDACKERNKKLYCFYNDDNDRDFNLDSNIQLYRTSFYKSTKKENEFAIPVFVADTYDRTIVEELSIGYCGAHFGAREHLLQQIEKSPWKTDIIRRKHFQAKELPPEQAKQEFLNNMSNNMFSFCFRGDGNFSYRFYEIMMMGRIPLLVNTDCVFPFEEQWNLHEHCFVIDQKDMSDFKDRFETFVVTEDLKQMQLKNRNLWIKHFSPTGFVSSFIERHSYNGKQL